MFKKALLVAGAFTMVAVSALPASASPNSMRADLGKNNSGATLEHRADATGWHSHVRVGGLKAGVYTYTVTATGKDAGGNTVSKTTTVCSGTLKAGQDTFECGAEKLAIAPDFKPASFSASVTKAGVSTPISGAAFKA